MLRQRLWRPDHEVPGQSETGRRQRCPGRRGARWWSVCPAVNACGVFGRLNGYSDRNSDEGRRDLDRLRKTGKHVDDGILRYDDLTLNADAHRVERDGEQIELSATEFKVLRYLLINAGRVVSKDQLLDHVWRYDFDGETSIVENFISLVRKKVDAGRTRLIKTVRGVGYVCAETEPGLNRCCECAGCQPSRSVCHSRLHCSAWCFLL